MDIFAWLQGLFEGSAIIVVVIVVVAILVVGFIIFKLGYRITDADEALVITGGKKGPRIIKSGGAYVSFLRKSERFPLSNMTIQSDDYETQTSTKVPIVVKWTAQIRPDTKTEGALDKAIVGYIGNGPDDTQRSLKLTLDGEIRQVVATLTPDEVLTKKDEFSSQVTTNVAPKMLELGFELVSLNIAEVSDKNNYYSNSAAEDREEKRRSAEILTATAQKAINVSRAESEQVSETAMLDKQLVVAEKGRDVALRQAEFDQETAAAQGQVTVVRAQQEQAAAIAQQEVSVTQADTARKTLEIEAQSSARKSEIDAQAAGTVAKTQASAAAEAVKIEAQGKADAIQITTTAEADQVRARGQAEADAAKAKGEAEAAAILALGQAEAERERLMAEALAANDGANLQVRFAEIESSMRITIATETAKVVGNIGEKVTIVDMGAGSREGGGSVLTNLLGDLPRLMQQGDLQSQLLGGVPLGALLGSLVAGVRGEQQGTGMPLGLRNVPADKPTVDESKSATRSQVGSPAEPVDLEAPAADFVAEPGSEGSFADDAVENLQAAADAAPEILEHVRGIRDAAKPDRQSKK